MKLDYKDCGTIGFTCSTFDLLHAGHVVMLEEAKRHCDYLIVGLQTDPTIDRPDKNAPIQSVVERQIQLAAVKYIDEIVMYTTERDLEDLNIFAFILIWTSMDFQYMVAAILLLSLNCFALSDW